MRLALWDTMPAELFAAGVRADSASPWQLERHAPQVCVERLLDGLVDVALVPTLVALSHAAVFDVLPAAALSSWSYPYARLVLRRGLEQVETLAYAPGDAQAALLARVILHEHYGKKPTFTEIDGAAAGDLLADPYDAALVSGPAAATLGPEHAVLDLGQEWYELANYPMVWGLFCARRDEALPPMVEALKDAAKAAEAHRATFVQAREMPPALHAFYAQDLRLRFDDLALASLTELRQYVYFYQVTDELPDLPLYQLPDDGGDDEEDEPLL